MPEQSHGERIIGGLQELLLKMQTGLPVPVTELSRVVLPSGKTMIVHNETYITFGENKDVQEQEESGEGVS